MKIYKPLWFFSKFLVKHETNIGNTKLKFCKWIYKAEWKTKLRHELSLTLCNREKIISLEQLYNPQNIMNQNQLTDIIKLWRSLGADTSERNAVMLKYESLNHDSGHLFWS